MCLIKTGNLGKLKLQNNVLFSLEKCETKEIINTYIRQSKTLSSKDAFRLTC